MMRNLLVLAAIAGALSVGAVGGYTFGRAPERIADVKSPYGITALCTDQSEDCFIRHRLTQRGVKYELHETSDGAIWRYVDDDWKKVKGPRAPAYAGINGQVVRSVDGFTAWVWSGGSWREI